MSAFWTPSIVMLAAAAGACALPSQVLGSEVRVGAGVIDITPPLGIPLAGYYHERGADGVLDPLYSKALVIEFDGERGALVVLDLLNLNRRSEERRVGKE